MFTQKPEEPSEWAALPGELFDRDEADLLPEAPTADPFGLGIGATSAASIAVPVTGVIGSGSLAAEPIVVPVPESVPVPDTEDDGSGTKG